MSLQLNGPNEPVNGYKEFHGHIYKQMPLLIADSRTPLSAAGLMRRYLEVLRLHKNAPKELKPTYVLLVKAWEDNYFGLGDGAPRHSDGRMKVVPDAQYLRSLTTKTRMVSSAVDLSKDYAALAGEEFSRANVDKYCGMPLDKWAAKHNPVWLALAQGDKALLNAFVDARFERTKERFRYGGEMMGVAAPPVPNEGAAGRLWTIHRLGEFGRSWTSGHLHLDDDGSMRLVGVVHGVQHATAVARAKSPLERILGR